MPASKPTQEFTPDGPYPRVGSTPVWRISYSGPSPRDPRQSGREEVMPLPEGAPFAGDDSPFSVSLQPPDAPIPFVVPPSALRCGAESAGHVDNATMIYDALGFHSSYLGQGLHAVRVPAPV